MKKYMSLVVLCLLTFAVSARADIKIAVVDMQQAFKDYSKTQEAEKRMQDQLANYKKDHDDQMSDYQKMVEQAKALQESLKDPALSANAKSDKEQKLQDKAKEIQQREQTIRGFDQQSARLLQHNYARQRSAIIDEIKKTIEDFCKGKYTIVLDKSGPSMNGTPVLLYQEGLTDITAEVVKQLNANAAKAPSAPASSTPKTP